MGSLRTTSKIWVGCKWIGALQQQWLDTGMIIDGLSEKKPFFLHIFAKKSFYNFILITKIKSFLLLNIITLFKFCKITKVNAPEWSIPHLKRSSMNLNAHRLNQHSVSDNEVHWSDWMVLSYAEVPLAYAFTSFILVL